MWKYNNQLRNPDFTNRRTKYLYISKTLQFAVFFVFNMKHGNVFQFVTALRKTAAKENYFNLRLSDLDLILILNSKPPWKESRNQDIKSAFTLAKWRCFNELVKIIYQKQHYIVQEHRTRHQHSSVRDHHSP